MQLANFPGTVTCSFNSTEGGFGSPGSERFSGNANQDSIFYFGYSGQTVTVTCGSTQGSYQW